MKIGIIILAHKNPDQLSRLLDSLDDESVSCFIHIDKKSSIKEFQNASLKKRKAKVHFISKRYDGRWGGLGIVLATLEAMRVAVLDRNISHISLLSGQDFPITPVKDIVTFLSTQKQTNFIEFTEFNEKTWPNQLDRIESYNFRLFSRQYTYPYEGVLSLKQQLLHQAFKLYFRLPRLMPYNFKPFFGSQWWTLTIESCKEILKFIDGNSKYINYHRYSFLPDEFFFQTILLNSNHFNNEKFINSNMRFIKWEKGSSHPIALTTNNFDEIMKSQTLFARKFDQDVDAEVLNQINSAINE